MITNFKIFENTKELPKIGDYILARTNSELPGVKEFINNTIGVVVDITYNDLIYPEKPEMIVHYKNVPKGNVRSWFGLKYPNSIHIGNNCTSFLPDDIVVFASTKEELELKLDVKNFNL